MSFCVSVYGYAWKGLSFSVLVLSAFVSVGMGTHRRDCHLVCWCCQLLCQCVWTGRRDCHIVCWCCQLLCQCVWEAEGIVV